MIPLKFFLIAVFRQFPLFFLSSCLTVQNEKYIGDTLCQKTFRTKFPFQQRVNHGELDQFYVEGTHPAIISREKFEKVQSLRQMKTKHFLAKGKEEAGPLAQKMICGNCGALLYRRVTRKGTITWSCERHLKGAANCPVGLIPQGNIYEAFVRVYNKLRLHEGLILRPALNQMEELKKVVQMGNPAMLEINRAIAQATEQSHKISTLQAKGLLDTDTCASRLAALEAQLTQLRAKRRRLLKNDAIGETAEALRQAVDNLRQGPERLDEFDAELFADLIKRIIVDSGHRLRFQFYGGFEVTEHLQEDEI